MVVLPISELKGSDGRFHSPLIMPSGSILSGLLSLDWES
jgi:hypothetical protein